VSHFQEIKDILDKVEARQRECLDARQIIKPASGKLRHFIGRLPKSAPNWMADEINKIIEMLEESIAPTQSDNQ
jgi:hypothetical protein